MLNRSANNVTLIAAQRNEDERPAEQKTFLGKSINLTGKDALEKQAFFFSPDIHNMHMWHIPPQQENQPAQN